MWILDLLLIGLVITLEPIPLTAFILILPGQGGHQGAASYSDGCCPWPSLSRITVLVTGNNPPSRTRRPHGGPGREDPHRVALVLIALRQRRNGQAPEPPKKPPNGNQPRQHVAFVCHQALQPLPQPWGLFAGGRVSLITGAKLTSWESYVALLPVLPVIHGVYIALSSCRLPAGAGNMIPRADQNCDRSPTDQVIIVVSTGACSLAGWQDHLSQSSRVVVDVGLYSLR